MTTTSPTATDTHTLYTFANTSAGQDSLLDRLARVYKLFWEAGIRDGLVSPLDEATTKEDEEAA